ncbi:hypothetical protein Esti_001143 [Eimeria stiedai]
MLLRLLTLLSEGLLELFQENLPDVPMPHTFTWTPQRGSAVASHFVLLPGITPMGKVRFGLATLMTDTGTFTLGTDPEVNVDFQELHPSFDTAALDSFVQGAAATQQKKKGKVLIAALVGALVLLAAAAAGGLTYAKKPKTKLQYEPAHLKQHAEEATKNFEEFVRLWASSSLAVRNMFCTNYFPRARGVEVVTDPVPAFRKELENCISVAMPVKEEERKEHALRLKYLSTVASAARGRLAGLQALETFVKNAPAGIFPQDNDAVDLVQYREFTELLWHLRILEGQVVRPFPKVHLNELEVAISFRFLRDEFNRQIFSGFQGFLQLVDETKAFVSPGGQEGGKEAPAYTFKMLPYSYMFPTQMFKVLLAQFKELNARRSLPFNKPEDFQVPGSASAAFNLLKDADGGALEASFRAIRYKDSFVRDWVREAKTPQGEFDLVQLGAFLL